MAEVMRAVGARWAIEECFSAAVVGHAAAIFRWRAGRRSDRRSFGNARLARQLLGTMITHQARRLGGLRAPTVDDLRTLLPDDLPADPAVAKKA
jgi:hypothetical protein